ncbi:MAG: HNH endonuclease [Rhodocyclales bacterium]|nr:HNH endonuclease [Rhodocyclales bacterium]
MKKRIPLNTELKDKLLVECGYKCSVPNCGVSQSLEFHHIDANPSNNAKDNIIVLCAVHHHQSDIKAISRRSLRYMKAVLLDIDGKLASSASGEQIEICINELIRILEIARTLPATSLRVLTREFMREVLNLGAGYHCRDGVDYNECLKSNELVVSHEQQNGPSLFKISEKGKLLCRFLYTSQYDLPGICFDPTIPLDIETIRFILDTNPTGYSCFGMVRRPANNEGPD